MMIILSFFKCFIEFKNRYGKDLLVGFQSGRIQAHQCDSGKLIESWSFDECPVATHCDPEGAHLCVVTESGEGSSFAFLPRINDLKLTKFYSSILIAPK
jgi:hypothetical protein